MAKKATAILAIAVLSLATACAPAAPTPTLTPEPTPTPVEVLATKPEHLEGTWRITGASPYYYFRFEADGTFNGAPLLDLLQESDDIDGRFWFEDGVYYEESASCLPIGSYHVYLTVEGRSVLSLRFEEIDDSDPSCRGRMLERARRTYFRLD